MRDLYCSISGDKRRRAVCLNFGCQVPYLNCARCAEMYRAFPFASMGCDIVILWIPPPVFCLPGSVQGNKRQLIC